jgi:hypothetical protein
MMQPDDIACTNFRALLARENANFTTQMNQQYASFFRYLENRTGIARIAFENVSSLVHIELEVGTQKKFGFTVSTRVAIMPYL